MKSRSLVEHRAISALGMVTFVDPPKVRSSHPDYGFTCAGFECVGSTRSGLVVRHLLPQDMPPAAPAHGTQLGLFAQEDMAPLNVERNAVRERTFSHGNHTYTTHFDH